MCINASCVSLKVIMLADIIQAEGFVREAKYKSSLSESRAHGPTTRLLRHKTQLGLDAMHCGTRQWKEHTKNWMCALSNVMDESIPCRDKLIRIVSSMTTGRVAVGHSCKLLANQASWNRQGLCSKSENAQERRYKQPIGFGRSCRSNMFSDDR
jgi:hypothetical protein